MTIPVEKLTEKLLRQHPVWEFRNDDEAGENVVARVKKLPISTADSRIVGWRYLTPSHRCLA